MVCLLGGHHKTYVFLIAAFLVFRYSSFVRFLTWNYIDSNCSCHLDVVLFFCNVDQFVINVQLYFEL